jgi:competence protein ComEA
MKNIAIVLLALLGWTLASAGPVNVNTADAEAISRELTGIGMAKAEAIVQYREQHGAFDVPEELLKVKGIGPRVLAANRENIRVTDE